jgi:competence protein ComEC
MKLKLLVYTSVIAIGLIMGYVRYRHDGLLHVVFCDVGQGDAIYVRFPTGHDMLVDGGPDDSVLVCLGEHMPFWDREIDIVLLTHPQMDHYGGLIDVAQRYRVGQWYAPPVSNNAVSYALLQQILKKRGIVAGSLYAGDRVAIGSVSLDILWPDQTWLSKRASFLPDINDASSIVRMTYGRFDVLLTGDAEQSIVLNASDGVREQVEVYKVGHHGSAGAVSDELLDLIIPSLAVISVGEGNAHGHPRADVLDTLDAHNVRTLRTDIDGTVEVVSDGGRWWVRGVPHR